MHTTCNNTNPAARRFALPAAFVLSTLPFACGAGTALPSAVPAAALASFVPTLKPLESGISLAVGQSHTFSAETNYPPGVRYLRQPITWSVVEAGGGRIDPISGAYTAPDRPGVYHLTVKRDDFNGVAATITVTVVKKGAFVPTPTPPVGGFTVRQGDSTTFRAV